jgi:hypothetical protein
MRRIAVTVTVVLLSLSLSHGASAQTTKPAPAAGAAAPARQPAKVEPAKTSVVTNGGVDAKRALATRMPEMKLNNVRLEDAFVALQDASGANIHVNWRALETVNVTRETPVTLRMRPLPLRKLLQYTLTEADGAGLITFYAEDGVIEVTTKDLADQRLITKVYPVEDLLLTIPDFTDAPDFQLQTSQTAGRGGGGGGGGQSLIGSGASQEQEDPAANKNARGQELVQLIMETVEPDVWRENGGTASIRFFRGRLIITAPRSVHEKIGGAVE